jgi:hypothetical protein
MKKLLIWISLILLLIFAWLTVDVIEKNVKAIIALESRITLIEQQICLFNDTPMD